MKRQVLSLALAAAVAVLGTSSEAQAWGAAHAGYTHVGPGGVYHQGYTAARGPYGAYGGAYRGGYGYGARYGGGYYGGYHAYTPYYYGGYRAYTPYYSGGYAAGGYHYGGAYGGYRAGVYRAW
jgi:hypothetical protein